MQSDSPGSALPPGRSERAIVFLIGAVQFINILDFVMVMPLGPDFARALGIATSKLGYIGGAYTAAAAISGLLGSFFLDRFDRRSALAVSMLGLVVGTALGGLAWNLPTLMAARVVAGAFGGPATSLSLSIIADVIPPARRGKAMGAVMAAFSVASVLGVPAGLELARLGTWRTPFFSVAGLGLVVAGLAVFFLPPLRLHLQRASGAPTRAGTRELLSRPLVQLSYLTTAVVMMAGFIVIPNISSHLQQNLGYPREHLGLLYFCGGIASFFTTRLAGMLVDRYGSTRVAAGATVSLVALTYVWLIHYVPAVPILALFVGFMISMAFRNVAYNTLASKVPLPFERARFMSFQSAVQHMASALGAFASSRLLVEGEGGRLLGMEKVGGISLALTAIIPVLVGLVERKVRSRVAPAPPADPQTGLRPMGPSVPRPVDER